MTMTSTTAALSAALSRDEAGRLLGQTMGTRCGDGLPSWAVVATGDKAAGTDVTRSMAERAGAKVTEVEGSHVIMVSQPQVVTDVILDAVAEVG
jgi:hypothetical protein